jgi:DNA replicative helicase MCM subunit Mcm2 (Cdc46/Mcm family)
MRTFTSLLVGFLAAGALVLAHHGLAAFDQTNKVTLKGTVTAFHFLNPHSVVEFEVKDDKGHVRKWQAEMTSPGHLKGWTATSLEPGNIVTVTGYRAKSGASYLWVTTLSSSNGVELKAVK